MRTKYARFLSISVILVLLAPVAHAQFAVIDVANLTQLISQAQQLEQQIETARSQLMQAQAEFQAITENCGNTLILRCAGSEHGGTSQFASRLIGEREVVRRHTSRGRDRDGWLGGRNHRRSTQVSEQWVTETAVMASELEQLPDLTGFLKTASSNAWLRVSFRP